MSEGILSKLKNRSPDAIAENDASESGKRRVPNTSDPNSPKAIARRKKAGVGRNDAEANFVRLSARLRADQARAKAAGNDTLAAKIAARIAELRKVTSEAK